MWSCVQLAVTKFLHQVASAKSFKSTRLFLLLRKFPKYYHSGSFVVIKQIYSIVAQDEFTDNRQETNSSELEANNHSVHEQSSNDCTCKYYKL